MGLRGWILGAIIEVVLLAVFIQVGWLSPAKSIQENIVSAIILMAVKFVLVKLLGGK